MRKLARVGRPPSRDSSSARTSASRSATSAPDPAASTARASSRSNCGTCQASSSGTSVRPRTASWSAAIHSPTPVAARSAARPSSSRCTSSARRPASSTSLLPTSSSGRPRPRWRWSSPLITTPSRIRSRPARQVLWAKPSIEKSARCSASIPQRTPASDTQPVIRARSSSLSRNRARTASAPARSSTSLAVTRPPASSTSRDATASSGLVLVRARSASRTRSRWAGWPPCSTTSARPKPAEISGAKVSMSGHMTRMSRGSRVGSSSSRPTRTSRSTSTCRAGPWHAWTWTLRSSAARRRPARSPAVGAALARRSDCSQPSRVWSLPCPSAGVSRLGAGAPRTSTTRGSRVRRSSRLSRPREASRGWPTRAADSSPVRMTGPPSPARASHSAGDGCGSQRWTSRHSPSAASSSTSVTGSRVCPKRDNRSGRSRPAPPSRRSSRARACRRSGAGTSTWASRRRHSSGCQARSSSSGAPAPSVSRPSRQSVTRVGRWTAYEAKSPASRRATE